MGFCLAAQLRECISIREDLWDQVEIQPPTINEHENDSLYWILYLVVLSLPSLFLKQQARVPADQTNGGIAVWNENDILRIILAF